MDLAHGPIPIEVHGQPVGSAHGLLQLFQGDLTEVGRPGAKVKKANAKKSNLHSSFHSE